MADLIEQRIKISSKEIILSRNLAFYDRIINVILKDNKEYFFKNISLCPEYIYNEMIIKYLARQAGINCVNPVVASINLSGLKFSEKIGVLEESYIEDGYKSIVGYDIMEEYLDYLISIGEVTNMESYMDEGLTKSDYMKEYMNTLECIYKALLFHFKDESNSIEIVNEIFNEIVKRYAFDYITMQNDRSLNNWAILEGKDKKSKLSKMFDNEDAFYKNYMPKQKIISYKEQKYKDLEIFFDNDFFNTTFNEEQIKNFYNNFIEIYESLSPDNVFALISRMELENGNIKSNIYKNNLMNNYLENYAKITKIIQKCYNLGNHR